MTQQSIPANFPLSVNQEGYWFLDQVEPGNPAYNIFGPLRVRGPLDSSLLELAMNRVVERHESLRTTFIVDPKDGQPCQIIADTYTMRLEVIDLQHLPESKRADQAHRQADEYVQQPFDLTEPLFRAALWRIGPEDHLFVPVMHHIISDFQSALIAGEEIFATYSALRDGNDPQFRPLSVRYVDYSTQQREYLQNGVLEKQISYWKSKLHSLAPAFSIPLDFERPEKRTFRPASETFELPASSIQPLKKFARAQGVTLFLLLLAAFEALLHRYSGEEDIPVGVPISGRNRSDVRKIIGCFANMLVFRTSIPHEITFLELLARVRQTAIEAYEHQDIPFTKLVEAIQPKRDRRYNPLVQVLFDYVKLPVHWDLGGGLSIQSERQERGTTDLDLFVLLIEKEGTIHGRFGYNPDIFKPETVKWLTQAYCHFLERIVHDPAVPLAQLELPKELESKRVSLDAVQSSVRIAATFSAEPVEPYLRFWFEELHRSSSVQFAPYSQVFQQLLDPESLLAQNRDGLNVLLFRFEDWQRYEASTDAAKIERHAAELIDALRSLRPKVPYLICLCPPSPAMSVDTAMVDLFERLEHQLAASLSSVPGVHFVSYIEIESRYPVVDYYDHHTDQEGHIPYTDSFFAALATVIARKWDALTRSPYKVIVLDCDQTLWNGVCGEEGPCGVEIAPPHRFLQEFVVRQGEQGMLLCLCSKNHEADVWSVFDYHTDMPLKREHIVKSRINWARKSDNLKELSQELQLGLDTFIFIDDSPIECAEVRTHCPEALTLQLPASNAQSFLENVWAFDRTVLTHDDRQRTIRYQQEASRNELRKRSATLKDFLDGLQLEVDIHPMREDETARVAQLTQRTNQFNFTTRRRTETEIREIQCGEAFECLTVDVRDRFGDYGLVGVVIFALRESILAVDTFLLSCRVLGRGVEYLMMKRLGQIVRDRGLAGIDVHYIATDRNTPAADFLYKVATSFDQTIDGRFMCRMSPDEAANVQYRPEVTEFEPAREAQIQQSVASSNKANHEKEPGRLARYVRTAIEFDEVSKIVAAVRSINAKPATDYLAASQPTNEVERRLIEMISDILVTDSITIDDDFFDLGGHSIAAVQLLGKIARTFHVRLPLQRLFEKPTVRHLASVIEEMQSQGCGRRTEERLISLKDEVVLDPCVCRTDDVSIGHHDPSRVLLTGATGFLGAFLLADLLEQTNARVYCLVRASSPADAMERLKTHLQSWMLWNKSFASRIVAIPADLTQPLFGMSRDYFNHLADTVDAIYHSGAYVDFIQPYIRLKEANVTGTATVLRLAAQGRYKPVHFISTVNVFNGADSSRIIYESDQLSDERELHTGYDQSKWVAESLVNVARLRGIPANIYRPGPIIGHSQSGVSNADDLLHRIIAGGIRWGYMPDMDIAVNLVPIDYVSGAIVQISRQPSALGKTFHLVNPNTVNVRQLLDWLESSRYSFSRLPYSEWRRKLLQEAERDPENPIYPLVPFFAEKESASDFRKAFFDARNTVEALAPSSIKCPPITRELVQRYLAYLDREGPLSASWTVPAHLSSEANDSRQLCAAAIGD